MIIIVTGSNGFVGQHLIKLLRQSKKDKVFSLDRKQADITKRVQVEKYIQKIKPDQVYHLAGFASGAGKDKDLIYKVNVDGTLNILKALKKLNKPVRILLASTAYVYANTPVCASEDAKTVGNSFYDKSKIMMEREALKYRDKNIEIVITRASNHTGPGQKLGFVVPDFCEQIVKANPPAGGSDEILIGNLEAKRDMFDVRDCVRAYKIVMAKGKSGEIYNIGTGKVVTIKSVLEKLIKISGKKIKTKQDPERLRPSDISKNCVNISKIKKLGWKPEIRLNQTLEECYKYYEINSHPELVSGSTQSNNSLNDIYSQWSSTYDEYAKEHNMAIKKVHPTFAKLFEKSIKGKGLDLGCGTGLVTLIASKYAKEIIGIDINNEMLNEARKKKSLGAKLSFLKNDIIQKLPFPDEHFDFVISSLAINHIENVNPVFAEVYRVLKHDGVFIFDEPDSGPRTPEQLKYKAEPKKIDILLKYKREGGKVWHMHQIDDELKQLKKVGFNIEELIEIKYDEEVKSLMKNYKYHTGKNFFNIIKARKKSSS